MKSRLETSKIETKQTKRFLTKMNTRCTQTFDKSRSNMFIYKEKFGFCSDKTVYPPLSKKYFEGTFFKVQLRGQFTLFATSLLFFCTRKKPFLFFFLPLFCSNVCTWGKEIAWDKKLFAMEIYRRLQLHLTLFFSNLAD